MEAILLMDGFEKLLQLLDILHILSHSREIKELSSPAFHYPIGSLDVERVNTVYQHILVNYRNKITLQEVASLLSMSTSTFCRFFRKRTGKTFSKTINELRVGHACRLLMESEWNVTQICYESGFNNFSYFQRQFKIITKTTPLKYKQEFLQK
jgi:AraC-like DNA-binding protein